MEDTARSITSFIHYGLCASFSFTVGWLPAGMNDMQLQREPQLLLDHRAHSQTLWLNRGLHRLKRGEKVKSYWEYYDETTSYWQSQYPHESIVVLRSMPICAHDGAFISYDGNFLNFRPRFLFASLFLPPFARTVRTFSYEGETKMIMKAVLITGFNCSLGLNMPCGWRRNGEKAQTVIGATLLYQYLDLRALPRMPASVILMQELLLNLKKKNLQESSHGHEHLSPAKQ